MKTITKNLLKISAEKLMFEMNESQYDTLLKEFEILLKQMEIFESIEGIDEVSPMAFPYEIKTTYLREDVAEESLDKKSALKNADNIVDGQIALPKVVG
jgi:aspartyl-tRNA(Asn)/glutamyl-tRNA(Gln) amidotransferase subunit C